jgi:hypothetical protein
MLAVVWPRFIVSWPHLAYNISLDAVEYFTLFSRTGCVTTLAQNGDLFVHIVNLFIINRYLQAVALLVQLLGPSLRLVIMALLYSGSECRSEQNSFN